MQPSRRLANKRLKRRRAQRAAPSNDPAPECPSIFDAAESEEDDEDAPVRRRIVGGVEQPPKVEEKTISPKGEPRNSDTSDATAHNAGPGKEEPLPVVTRSAPGEQRSQIARLMARRRARADRVGEAKDEAAQFRDDIARCADVDEPDYDAVSVEGFGSRLLAAMGWTTPQSRVVKFDDDMPHLDLGAPLSTKELEPLPEFRIPPPLGPVRKRAASSTVKVDEPRPGVERPDSAGDEAKYSEPSFYVPR